MCAHLFVCVMCKCAPGWQRSHVPLSPAAVAGTPLSRGRRTGAGGWHLANKGGAVCCVLAVLCTVYCVPTYIVGLVYVRARPNQKT
jgi:hypothetical protein